MCFLYLQLHFFRLKQEQVLPACLALMGPQRDFNRFTVPQTFLSLVPLAHRPGKQPLKPLTCPALKGEMGAHCACFSASKVVHWYLLPSLRNRVQHHRHCRRRHSHHHNRQMLKKENLVYHKVPLTSIHVTWSHDMWAH